MKKLFEEIDKIRSIANELMKANHEQKEKIKKLSKEEKKQLKGFEGSMGIIIDQLSLFKAALFIMIRNK